MRRRTPAARALALLTAFAIAVTPTVAVAPTPARAQSLPPGLPIIRDAEIEQLLRDYTQPILRAAGLAQQNIQVTIINDRSFNAFVIDGQRIFVNAGALIDAKVPNEVIGVLAHETGHIAGGHLSRLRQQLAQAQAASIIAMMLGIGGAVAAARSGGNVGNPAAAILGPQEIDPPLAAVLSARAGGAGRPRRREVPRRHRPVRQGHVRHLQASVRPDPVRRAQRRSLHAVASDAGGTRRGARGHRQEQPQLGQEGSAGACSCATT